MKSDFTMRSNSDSDSRVGVGYTDYLPTCFIMPVQLPALQSGESVSTATLTVNLQGWSNWGNVLQDIDLYGIWITSSSAAATDPDYFVDGANPGNNPYAVKLQDALATPGDFSGAQTGSNKSITKASIDVGSFFQSLYNSGAQSGDYAFLVLTHDGSLGSLQRYYQFSSANSSSYTKPSITFDLQQGDISVSWSVGNAASMVDGVANSGPITFTWTFNQAVQHGVYLDGTPWVIWQPGLQLVSVSPSKQVISSLPDYGAATIANGIVDATCINPGLDHLGIDRRMGDTSGTDAPWANGADVWNEQPTSLSVGDCIVSGRGRRDSRYDKRHMIFTALGVCNIVGQDQTGHYRPPLRMPANLRASLVTPTEVDVSTLPTLSVPQPKDWSGNSVTLNIKAAALNTDADALLNGPIGNCGLQSYAWYEQANGMLNHDIAGTDTQVHPGYQRNVSERIATCLYTAFDTSVATDKRQRSLNKFIQVGLNYYYMHCLNYRIWNGGGGHCDAVEGVITLSGALLGDAAMVEAIKYQRFYGSEVGLTQTTDMLNGSLGDYARTEALYTVGAATWQSGNFVKRSVGSGAATLADAFVNIDMARSDMALNDENVPYINITTVGSESAIQISSSYQWKVFSQNQNGSSDQKRSYRYIPGAVIRIDNDPKIRKVTAFKTNAGGTWTDSSWYSNGGVGGVIYVYPALTTQEIQSLGSSGALTTGVTTHDEAPDIVLWESWPADSLARVLKGFYASPIQDYLDNKLCDNYRWMPFYNILPDPSASGKMLYEESAGYQRVADFTRMQRDFGSAFWDQFSTGNNVPSTPTIEALVRYYILGDQMPSSYCKLYGVNDTMWNE